MVIVSVKSGAAAGEVVKGLKEAGATKVSFVEFTNYLRVEGLERDAAQAVAGVDKVGESFKELRG
jgi:hypothetical protein